MQKERSPLANDLIVRSVSEWQWLAHSLRILLAALPTLYLGFSVSFQGRTRRTFGEFISSDGNHMLGCSWICLLMSILLSIVAHYAYFLHLETIVNSDEPQICITLTSRWRRLSDVCVVGSIITFLLGIAFSLAAAIIQKEIFS